LRSERRGPRVDSVRAADIAHQHVARRVVRKEAGPARELIACEAGTALVVVVPPRLVVGVLEANEAVRVCPSGRDVLCLHHQSDELVGARRGKHTASVEDHTSGAEPPTSISVTPTEAPLAATSISTAAV